MSRYHSIKGRNLKRRHDVLKTLSAIPRRNIITCGIRDAHETKIVFFRTFVCLLASNVPIKKAEKKHGQRQKIASLEEHSSSLMRRLRTLVAVVSSFCESQHRSDSKRPLARHLSPRSSRSIRFRRAGVEIVARTSLFLGLRESRRNDFENTGPKAKIFLGFANEANRACGCVFITLRKSA